MKKFYTLFIICILLTFNVLGQENQKIQIIINDFKDSTLLLTSYYGDKIQLVDTAYSINNKFIFKYDTPLAGGIYMAVSPQKTKLFEFIVNNEKKIFIETDTVSYINNLKVKSSKENEVFFNYVRYNEKIFKESAKINDKLKNLELSSTEKEYLISKVDSLNTLSIDYKLKLIETYPELFVSKLINSMQDVQIPDSISKTGDSVLLYRYYKNHYWDYLDLTDSRFLRTPMLNKKLSEYFNKLVLFQPDTIISNIDLLIEKARSSEENYSYLLWYFIKEYQNPKYMGFDKVFVHLVEKYFNNPDYKIINNTESVKETLVDRSDKIKPLLLGSKAPNLILIDTSGAYTSFDFIKNKYILILFYDYECGICKNEIKYITENQSDWKYDIGIFAVNVNGELDNWKKFIQDHHIESWYNVNGTRSVTADFHDLYDIYGTPVLYLLDEKRNIIAKRMGAEQIISIIDRVEKSKSKN